MCAEIRGAVRASPQDGGGEAVQGGVRGGDQARV